MCEIKAHKILKHVATRWLSLGKCLDRLFEQPLIKTDPFWSATNFATPLYFPVITEALSQPNDKQFVHEMSYFTNSLFIKLKMCSAVQLSLQLGIERRAVIILSISLYIKVLQNLLPTRMDQSLSVVAHVI
jgi:hypothetical protein